MAPRRSRPALASEALASPLLAGPAAGPGVAVSRWSRSATAATVTSGLALAVFAILPYSVGTGITQALEDQIGFSTFNRGQFASAHAGSLGTMPNLATFFLSDGCWPVLSQVT